MIKNLILGIDLFYGVSCCSFDFVGRHKMFYVIELDSVGCSTMFHVIEFNCIEFSMYLMCHVSLDALE